MKRREDPDAAAPAQAGSKHPRARKIRAGAADACGERSSTGRPSATLKRSKQVRCKDGNTLP